MSTRASYIVNPAPNHVADYARVLDAGQESALEAHIREGTTQPYVVFANDVDAPVDLAKALFTEWNLEAGDVVVVIATDTHRWGLSAPSYRIDADWRAAAGQSVGVPIQDGDWVAAGTGVADAFAGVSYGADMTVPIAITLVAVIAGGAAWWFGIRPGRGRFREQLRRVGRD